MIARISGKLSLRRPDHVVVDVGGVGYRIFVSLPTFCDLPESGGPVSLFTHTVVREDAIHLYGFLSEEEWSSFASLVTVKGVGPKLALGILSAARPRELWAAIRAGDSARLNKIPGVGKKTAAQLILDLTSRLPKEEREGLPAGTAGAAAPLAEDALSALLNLGYPEAKAKKAVEAALSSCPGEPGLEEILRKSLAGLL